MSIMETRKKSSFMISDILGHNDQQAADSSSGTDEEEDRHVLRDSNHHYHHHHHHITDPPPIHHPCIYPSLLVHGGSSSSSSPSPYGHSSVQLLQQPNLSDERSNPEFLDCSPPYAMTAYDLKLEHQQGNSNDQETDDTELGSLSQNSMNSTGEPAEGKDNDIKHPRVYMSMSLCCLHVPVQ